MLSVVLTAQFPFFPSKLENKHRVSLLLTQPPNTRLCVNYVCLGGSAFSPRPFSPPLKKTLCHQLCPSTSLPPSLPPSITLSRFHLFSGSHTNSSGSGSKAALGEARWNPTQEKNHSRKELLPVPGSDHGESFHTCLKTASTGYRVAAVTASVLS